MLYPIPVGLLYILELATKILDPQMVPKLNPALFTPDPLEYEHRCKGHIASWLWVPAFLPSLSLCLFK